MLNRHVVAVCVAAGTLTSLALAGDPHASPAPAAKPAQKTPSKPTTYNKQATPTTQTKKVTPAAPATKTETKPETKSEHTDTASNNENTQPKSAVAAPAPSESSANAAADDALNFLVEGNARWVSNKPQSPNIDNARREEVAAGQHPLVTILTCADSRIPVERVFDRGVGDVFVIRVAGNVAGGSETGTIEYGVEHLKTPLLVVMGHTKCGAVAAAATNAPVHGFVAKLVSNIQPAIERARRANPDADEKTLSALAVNENVWQSVFDLFKASQPVRELAASGQLKVVGAVYDISTGKVDFLGEHPWQNELLATLNTKPSTAVAAKPVETHTETKAKSEPAQAAAADDHNSDHSGH